MPIRRAAYPANWETISRLIKERAGYCCEGTPRHPDCRAAAGWPHPATGSRVVLTCAHYPDPDPMNCDPDNLRALCQRCHLDLDYDHHARNRRNTLAQRLAAEQRDLFEEEETASTECPGEVMADGPGREATALG